MEMYISLLLWSYTYYFSSYMELNVLFPFLYGDVYFFFSVELYVLCLFLYGVTYFFAYVEFNVLFLFLDGVKLATRDADGCGIVYP